MIPIPKANILSKGIVIYIPNKVTIDNSPMTISIYYSTQNPLLRPYQCDPREDLIWTLDTTMVGDGVLALYERDIDLIPGFYRVVVNIESPYPTKGTETYYIYKNTPRLIVGLPYSAYSPIDII